MNHAPMTHGTNLLSYTIGFALSLLLTFVSFLMAPHMGALAAPLIVICAVLQLLVQLVFFLHLGLERGQRSNLSLFIFVCIIIGILVGGTLWIMQNLSHLHVHSATPNDLYENGVVAPQNELH